MNDDELERRLTAWYRAEVGEGESASLSLRRDVAAIPRTNPRPARRFGRGRGVTLLAAAALLLVGGAAAVGSGLLRLPSLVPPGPVPSVAVVPSPAVLSSPTPRMPGWSAGGSMIEARSGHTATLLPDGRVLVAGGDNANGTSAELYDPGSRSWTATGSTATPFTNELNTATLLHDGRVLLTGGFTYDATAPNNWRFVAETYDPGRGSWTAAGDGFKGGLPTLLPDGTVLMSGVGSDGRAAQVYDPSSGTWTATGSMVTEGGVTATLLHDGRVLVSGTLRAAPGCQDTPSRTCPSVSVVQLYDPGSGTWTASGSMAAPRTGNTATLLSDGRVLVAGGGNATVLASAELYDPASGTWTPTGKMVTARSGHTATLLPDGRVLVAGGMGNTTSTGLPDYLASAELYDPATGSWTAAGKMTTARSGSTATLLPDGTVLVAGGTGTGTGPLASTELYDPGTGAPPISGPAPAPLPTVSTTGSPAASVGPVPTPTPGVTPGPGTGPSAGAPAWTLTGSMVITRSQFTATLLPDGRVLAAGGSGLIADLASAELYDPASGTWTATGSMNTPREGNTATLLRDGEVLVAGGVNNGTILASAELYDPASGTWTATGKMVTARSGHTATLLPDGRVLVVGGMGNSTSTVPGFLASAELYDPATGSWTAAGKMSTARSGSTATLLPDGRVLVVGGNGDREGGPAAGELYDPHNGSWTATRNLVMRRPVNTATLLPNGTVLVAGGSGTSAELYNPATGSWRATGSMGTARDYAMMATLLPDGRVLVLGGDYNSGGNGTSAELYNPSRGTWTATPKMLIAGSTATLLPDGTVLVAGHGAAWSPPGSAELYNPSGT